MKITVVGAGYVGLSMATLLAKYNEVALLDIISDKVDMINKRVSPIEDPKLNEYLKSKKLNLTATLNAKKAYSDAKYIIIATPTSFDIKNKKFNVSSVRKTIKEAIEINPKAMIIIKSTVPIHFTQNIRREYKSENIVVSPEFLREGKALEDLLHPSRIIIGEQSQRAQAFAEVLETASDEEKITKLFVKSSEAEAIKLFSNTYLAMRIAFFNELDTYAYENNLNTKQIINGVCLDKRIGNFYNNPSFGYGGYCLPKDSKQLVTSFGKTPHSLIRSVIKSNEIRKQFIAKKIKDTNSDVVGIYRLTMKKNSDNFRSSAIMKVIEYLKKQKIQLIIYEPLIQENCFKGIKVLNDLELFKTKSDLIVTNRNDSQLNDVKHKIYTRDIYLRD